MLFVTPPLAALLVLVALAAPSAALGAPPARPAPRASPTPSASPAPARAAVAPLTVQLQPRELRLAEGGRVRVRIVSPDGTAPVVSASVGRIEGLREVSSGLYETEYVPPDSVDPLIAFVTAATPAGGFGYGTITLAGVRTVTVRAPHRSLVGVTVAGETFGPIPADGTGRAVLRVDVPPGVYTGTSGGKAVDLDVKPRSFAHVALDRPAVEASERGTVTVRVIALDDSGKPMRRSAVKLDASEGKLSKATETAPGVYTASWSVEPGKLGKSKISARVEGRPPAIATALLDRVAGAPARVEVDANRTTLVAGEGDELQVTGRIVDAAGNPTDAPARLIVSIASGESARLLPDAVIEWLQSGEGGYTGRVQVPRHRSGRQQLELKVIGPGGLVGTRTVALVPGRVSAVRVEPEETLYADGRERQLRVVLLDEHGNRAEAEGSAIVTATRGTVGTPTRSAPGVYVVEYRSSLSAQDYDDVITARVGPVEGRGEFRVRARGGTVVLGLKGGYTVGTGSLSSPGGALELGVWSPSFRHGFGVVLDVRYFGYGQDETLNAGTVSLPISADASFLAFEPSLAWRRPMLSGMLWLGAGPGIVRAASSVSAPGQPDLSSTSWVPSAHASASWGLPLGPGIPFAELKGAWQAEADDAPVRGSLSTLTLNVGYRFDVL